MKLKEVALLGGGVLILVMAVEAITGSFEAAFATPFALAAILLWRFEAQSVTTWKDRFWVHAPRIGILLLLVAAFFAGKC